ncbi:hypothetical protein [Vreelandella salicampi]|uniref:Uncharacterized protein n=1 Tax=Vreelandella salicampi TaxID=1449798 RepID=A0A7Z0LJW9_9GAMM|nr:hypothetical protein [Halomonas salicampi]NYS60342.1 hypothetical protein [Halomonas salicampi]
MSTNVDLNSAILVRTALKTLSPGMYTVRYLGSKVKGGAGSAASANIPLALSQAPIRMAGEIEFICPEGITHQTLAAPGDYLLVNVKGGDAVLAASKYSPRPLDGKVDIHWRIEPLNPAQPLKSAQSSKHSQRDNAQQGTQRKKTTTKVDIALPLTLKGHIERRGDITVNDGEWLGDPSSQARLEGFAIDCAELPQGVQLIAGGKVGQKTQQVNANEFFGTRQKATPITQLAICLSSPNTDHLTLKGEAAFSDGSRRPLGSPKAVTGSAGSHLVAVRLSLETTKAPPATQQLAVADERAGHSSRSRWLDPEFTQIRQG